ncbi:MAG TPA: GGDEF domain-containing protein [Acidimicrobiales bacterium]|nr:GGDEF domain-containing protein [Acidimicrobiales bacterium]
MIASTTAASGSVPPGDGHLAPVADMAHLPALLVRSPSAIGFVHQALEAVAAARGLRDALLVVDGPARRQAFRLRRGGWTLPAGSPLPAVERAGLGLHTDPSTVDDATATLLTGLAEVALALEAARREASRDVLTGLLNRRSYDDALDQAAARSLRYGWRFALVLLDLDHFKDINDRFGHGGGDEALRRFGADLRSCLRGGDVAARVGGDEFAVIVASDRGRPLVEPLVERLRELVSVSSGPLGVQFSAGAAHFPDDADTVEGLIRLADQRLFADKARS